MTSEAASVMLVDDHPLFRKGLQQLIGMSENLQIAAQARNGAEAVKLGLRLRVEAAVWMINQEKND